MKVHIAHKSFWAWKNGAVKLEKGLSLENVSMLLAKQVSNVEGITKVEKVVDLKHEVCKLTKLHAMQLKEKRKGLQDRLIGVKFNMDDQKL